MDEKVFCGDGTYKVYGYSKQQVDSSPTINLDENCPLSLDELREMSKEGRYPGSSGARKYYYYPAGIQPVYLMTQKGSGYGSVTFEEDKNPQIWWVGYECPHKMSADEYGKTWVAYRKKNR